MMDELELLKRDWQQQEASLPKLSYDEIYKMIRKKSSSIVKWIFLISIMEFGFWLMITVFASSDEFQPLENSIWVNILNGSLEIIPFVVIAYFSYRFYQNYKRISATDSARKLMKNILDTRKTVMRYVWFNIGLFAIIMLIVLLEVLILDPPQEFTQKIATADSAIMAWFLLAITFIFVIAILGGLLWLFYRLLYGILLKSLNTNYKELKKLEV
ncbi:Membrane protein [Croceitalea dokdonensis DOKDO 023]|uniref:Membrane protein n=2 Tax=Croceitalea TaxID=574891 RepID=A0A0P7ARH3_9FLAO|nr:hypothetical protein [Croceitalea dokdonensis]KPM30453.1 Membrane protein [Croceitalea dokdonensis DOKDO 023]